MKRKRMENCLVIVMMVIGAGYAEMQGLITPGVAYPVSDKTYQEFVGKRYQVITPLVIAKYEREAGYSLLVPKSSTLTKQDLGQSFLDEEGLWHNLIENGYIDEKGLIQDKFRKLGFSRSGFDSFRMQLKDEYKKDHVVIFQLLYDRSHGGIQYVVKVPPGAILVIHHVSRSENFEEGTLFYFISEFETQGIFKGRFFVDSLFIHKKSNKDIALKEIISADPQYLREIND